MGRFKTCAENRRSLSENLGEQFSLLAMFSLRPQAIPVQVKVILVGSPYLYQLLYHYDDDFRKLFKIKADFDAEMAVSRERMSQMASFVASHTKRAGLFPFDRTGVARLVEHSARLAGHQEKLSTRFNEIVEIIAEADAWTRLMGDELVRAEHVARAIEEKVYRSNTYEQKLQQLLAEGTILLDLTGEKVGQVNGLSVIDSGDYAFGRPTRITAVTYLGREGIINIERETKLSGRLHDKGLLTLTGYLAAACPESTPPFRPVSPLSRCMVVLMVTAPPAQNYMRCFPACLVCPCGRILPLPAPLTNMVKFNQSAGLQKKLKASLRPVS